MSTACSRRTKRRSPRRSRWRWTAAARSRRRNAARWSRRWSARATPRRRSRTWPPRGSGAGSAGRAGERIAPGGPSLPVSCGLAHQGQRETRSELSAPHGSVATMPPSDIMVSARGLTKCFGGFTAVDGIDFELHRGEAFGFLGPNGAGKSSTMRMLGCVSPPSGGELRILGLNPLTDGPVIRARLGVVPQEDTLDVELTVRENLLIYGRYFGLPRQVIKERSERLLDFVQLSDRAKDHVEPLSGGLKRRLTIAR